MGRKRSNITVLSHLLATCPAPVYAVDDQRKIVYSNGACTEWLGIDVGDLIGQRCEYHSVGGSESVHDVAAGLCPPPEVFLGQRTNTEVACRTSDGRLSRRRAECLPLGDTRLGCSGVFVVVETEDLGDTTPAVKDETEPRELHRRLRRLIHDAAGRYQLDQIIGEDPTIVRAREQVRLATASDCRVVVVGPPGSGREHIARSIHYAGAAKDTSPLAPLACSLLDAELLETTVSSFIASCAQLETEQPPALLLLEVDQLPSDAQTVLAGVLSIGELNVRTISTARTPLGDLAAQGQFRHDLACELGTLVIQIPPLSERRNDIPLLAQHFLEQTNANGEKQLAGFSVDAMDQLTSYPWPENVDELSEFVKAACEKAAGPVIQTSDLPERVRLTAEAEARPAKAEEAIVLDEFLSEIEKELLLRALRQAKGNKAKAARMLGVTRERVLRRIRFFGIE
ncbi:MAG: sigma 54-interacting transcriptional regulator [Planctomycetes bacterium]|nr:sigma 54-interacting transcriptional regulator [Planctomycetota bacterium]MBL7037204.1 sigma 54-interacting transcriptional regulator [Pirellulaceae bacterium]